MVNSFKGRSQSMKPYPKYKDSGISWIGQIPEHWEKDRAKNLFYRENRTIREGDEIITCFRDGQVTLRRNRRTEGFTESLKECGYQGIRKGDLVIHQMDAFAGSIGISDSDGKGTPVYICCNPRKNIYLNSYYCYVLREMARTGFIKSLYRGIRERSSDFRFETFSVQMLPIPPLNEQKQIVKWIESKTLKIEIRMSQRERELAMLSELRQAEIARAVTQGLNPDVPMKDTGIPWIPQIPEHWEIRKMKYCFQERNEKNHPKETKLSATQTHGVIPQILYENKGNHVVDVNKDFDKLKFVKVGDFVIHLRSFQGGIEYAYYQGIISAAYTILVPNEVEYSEFYKYLFKSHPYIQLLKTCVTGIREGQNIDYSILGNKFIPLPPIEEQKAIVTFIHKKISNIDSLISNLSEEIERLKELKQKLIADAVTGKIDLREEEIPTDAQ